METVPPEKDTSGSDVIAPLVEEIPPLISVVPPPIEDTAKPCTGKGSGRGTFGPFKLKRDESGRIVLVVEFNGTLGTIKSRKRFKMETGNVSFFDIQGNYLAKIEDLRFIDGPIGRVRFGFHDNFTRLSLNFRDSDAPQNVKTEVLCSPGYAIFRLTLEY
jgi:hypothetical protein